MSLFHRVMTIEFHVYLLCRFGTTMGSAVQEILVFMGLGALKANLSKSFSIHFTTNESFQMRYCMTLYLKGHWNYERSNLELLNLLNKNALFWNFQVLSLVFPMPLQLQHYTVPHLKALISGKLEPRGLRCGSTFIQCYVLLKKTYFTSYRGPC